MLPTSPKSSLKLASVIDDNDNWIGDKTVIVQVGDQIDRCRDKDCNTLVDTNDKNDAYVTLDYDNNQPTFFFKTEEVNTSFYEYFINNYLYLIIFT